VVMTLGTFYGDSHQCLAESIGSVHYVFDPIFFIHYASFLGLGMVSVETSGEQLILAGFR